MSRKTTTLTPSTAIVGLHTRWIKTCRNERFFSNLWNCTWFHCLQKQWSLQPFCIITATWTKSLDMWITFFLLRGNLRNNTSIDPTLRLLSAIYKSRKQGFARRSFPRYFVSIMAALIKNYHISCCFVKEPTMKEHWAKWIALLANWTNMH